MSITLESASRLSALKSKIDTATGKASSTLSQAVDNALEMGSGGGGVVSGTHTDGGGMYREIDVGVEIGSYATFVMVAEDAPQYTYNTEKIIITKEIANSSFQPNEYKSWISRGWDEAGGTFLYTEVLEAENYISMSGTRVCIETTALPALRSTTYRWYLIQ